MKPFAFIVFFCLFAVSFQYSKLEPNGHGSIGEGVRWGNLAEIEWLKFQVLYTHTHTRISWLYWNRSKSVSDPISYHDWFLVMALECCIQTVSSWMFKHVLVTSPSSGRRNPLSTTVEPSEKRCPGGIPSNTNIKETPIKLSNHAFFSQNPYVFHETHHFSG